MKHTLTLAGGLLSLGLLSTAVLAQNAIIYPAKGQSAEQTEKDKFECYTWARDQTGFDPMQGQQTAQTQQQSQGGGAVGRGAARGAAVGAVGGAIADNNVGRSAAIGAAVGGVAGGARRNQQQQAQQQQQQAAADQQAQQRATYDRAFKACMEGRGYTVN